MLRCPFRAMCLQTRRTFWRLRRPVMSMHSHDMTVWHDMTQYVLSMSRHDSTRHSHDMSDKSQKTKNPSRTQTRRMQRHTHQPSWRGGHSLKQIKYTHKGETSMTEITNLSKWWNDTIRNVIACNERNYEIGIAQPKHRSSMDLGHNPIYYRESGNKQIQNHQKRTINNVNLGHDDFLENKVLAVNPHKNLRNCQTKEIHRKLRIEPPQYIHLTQFGPQWELIMWNMAKSPTKPSINLHVRISTRHCLDNWLICTEEYYSKGYTPLIQELRNWAKKQKQYLTTPNHPNEKNHPFVTLQDN